MPRKKLKGKAGSGKARQNRVSKATAPTKSKASQTGKKPTTTTTSSPPPSTTSSKSSAPPPPPIIPFDPNDSILLVGEGDFSFARSIIAHHGCANVLATSYDTRPVLATKYPQAESHIAYIEGEGEQKVLCGVDATKLGQGPGQKEVRREKWDRIVFNFPHTGGKSTDVNRQVRYNQELLVSFFKAAIPLLSSSTPTSSASEQATIIVTLFESSPYTLWNIRDLARHVGLTVQRSFRFQAEAYPDYHHARTLGNIEGGGGWKGETRAARTFVFEMGEVARVEVETGATGGNMTELGVRKGKDAKRKRGAGGDSDDDSDE